MTVKPAGDVVDVVMRCRDEMPHTVRALDALARQQGVTLRVLFFDSGSRDGSREVAEAAGLRVISIDPRAYVPGRVLNDGMSATSSPFVAFVNADAVALDSHALVRLMEPLWRDPTVVATYARQIARADADSQTSTEYRRAFPEYGSLRTRHRHAFSMAASIVRRSAWQRLPFDEGLRYSEDVDWTWRQRSLGWHVVYVPESRFEHSHAYPLAGHYRRRAGEGRADTAIFHLGRPSAVGELWRPLAGSILRDARAGALTLGGAAIRTAQAAGYYAGRRAAARARSRAGASTSVEPHRGYTLDGSAEAERRIAADISLVAERVGEGLGRKLCALMLIGGYARGEGSVVARGGKLGPYNDYDFVVAVHGEERLARRKLVQIATRCTELLGVDVDLWPIDVRRLHRLPATLFWLDAALGGLRIVAGDRELRHRLPELVPRRIPLDECGRLLANRAVGLALSNLEPVDTDWRLARHAHKAVLACGDVRLLAADRYRPTVGARLAEIEGMAGAPGVEPALADAYRDAVGFRRRPDRWRPPGGDLRGWYGRTRSSVARWHLDYEQWRLGIPASPTEFAVWAGSIYPRAPDLDGLGRITAPIDAAVRGAAPLDRRLRHPRDRLARVAVLLGYASDDPVARGLAAALLGLGHAGRTEMHARLKALGERGG